MKHLLTALFLFFGMSVFAQSANTIDITINGQTSREQLAQLRTDLQAQGVIFSYAPQFDNQRRLISIQYKVSTSDNTPIGEGGHSALQQNGANVVFHVNAAAKTFLEEKDVVRK